MKPEHFIALKMGWSEEKAKRFVTHLQDKVEDYMKHKVVTEPLSFHGYFWIRRTKHDPEKRVGLVVKLMGRLNVLWNGIPMKEPVRIRNRVIRDYVVSPLHEIMKRRGVMQPFSLKERTTEEDRIGPLNHEEVVT